MISACLLSNDPAGRAAVPAAVAAIVTAVREHERRAHGGQACAAVRLSVVMGLMYRLNVTPAEVQEMAELAVDVMDKLDPERN